MNSLARRVEALERRSAPAMISAVEVQEVKAALWRKLGIGRQPDDIPAPISRKAVEKSGGSALLKLRSFLDSRGA
jgi:hypothetical protein